MTGDELKEAFVSDAVFNHAPHSVSANSEISPPLQTCHSPPSPGCKLSASASQKDTSLSCARCKAGGGHGYEAGVGSRMSMTRAPQTPAPLKNPSAPSQTQIFQAMPTFSKGHPELRHHTHPPHDQPASCTAEHGEPEMADATVVLGQSLAQDSCRDATACSD